jgi:hypothetical protein
MLIAAAAGSANRGDERFATPYRRLGFLMPASRWMESTRMSGSSKFKRSRGLLWAYAFLSGLSLAASGCVDSGEEPPRQPVAGIVLLDGRPLESGTIFFYPAGRAIPGSTVVTGDLIRHGRFAITRERGLPKGKYRIVISATRTGVQEPGRSGTAPARLRELIPPRFNQETELELEVKEAAIKELRIAIASS